MTTVVVNDSDDGDFCGDGYSGGQVASCPGPPT